MAHHSFQQHLHTVDIVVEILQGLLHALPHQGIGSEVDNRLNLVFRENLVQHRSLADIPLIEFCGRIHRIQVPSLEVVHDDNFLSLLHQLMDSMRTDIACTTANQNSHVKNSLQY